MKINDSKNKWFNLNLNLLKSPIEAINNNCNPIKYLESGPKYK